MSYSFVVRVIPKSGRQCCTLDRSGNLKVCLLSAPEDGAANRELIKFFSKLLHLPQRQIIIASGASSRIKRIVINAPLTQKDIFQACGLEVQGAIF